MRAAHLPPQAESSPKTAPVQAPGAPSCVPLNGNGQKVFARVPTHAVAVAADRRVAPRARLGLPVRLHSVNGRNGRMPQGLRTVDISSSGIYFLSPERFEPGTPVEMEVRLIDRPAGRGAVRLRTIARVVRSDVLEPYGWHGVAATFEELGFLRDEAIPPRFLKP